jgi:Fe-S-cluster containining protein
MDEAMAIPGPFNPLAFFKRMHDTFDAELAHDDDCSDPIERLSQRAYASFESSVACVSQEEASPIACRGGCASCCTIRVTATAPEILNIARFIRTFSDPVSSDLVRKIIAGDRATRNLDQFQRMKSSLVCPLIENDLCLAYSARPLACRGHASYDEEACRDALNGGSSEVPVSALHLTMRSLVQNAMQAALRDAGLAWGSYELNQALRLALCGETCEASWVAGIDVFAPASITDVSHEEMAKALDAIKAMAV